LPTAKTGLVAPSVFYFGNMVGESGNSAANADVSAADEIGARNNPTNLANPATRSNVYDFNRSGQVDSADQIIARNNTTGLTNQLNFLSVGAGGPFSPDSSTTGSAAVAIPDLSTMSTYNVSAGDSGILAGSDAGIASALAATLPREPSTPASGAPPWLSASLQNVEGGGAVVDAIIEHDGGPTESPDWLVDERGGVQANHSSWVFGNSALEYFDTPAESDAQ
jgi:hypothetical protein